MDETGWDTRWLGQDVDAHAPFGHFFKQRDQLQVGDACADTAMDSVTE